MVNQIGWLTAPATRARRRGRLTSRPGGLGFPAHLTAQPRRIPPSQPQPVFPSHCPSYGCEGERVAACAYVQVRGLRKPLTRPETDVTTTGVETSAVGTDRSGSVCAWSRHTGCAGLPRYVAAVCSRYCSSTAVTVALPPFRGHGLSGFLRVRDLA